MGNIKDNVAITVCNYNPFVLSVNTNLTSHVLAPCIDLDVPTVDTVTYSELVFVNSNSTAIRNGLIRFQKDVEKDVYEALQINNWEKIITNKEIEDAILNPDKDKLQKIVEITDSSIFDRVVAIYQGLINDGEHDISNRIMGIIDERKREFRRGMNVSRIQITAKEVENQKSDIEDMKKQNADLQVQLAQMQALMQKILDGGVATPIEKKEEAPQKKPGRPAKTTK